MSIFSDYEHGYMDEQEFRNECARMNREDRWEREHMYDEEEQEEEKITGNKKGGVNPRLV